MAAKAFIAKAGLFYFVSPPLPPAAAREASRQA
jgi:hypothetical protein